MGGLSSGPGPGLCLLTLVVLIVAQQVQSAPVQEDNSSPQSRAQGYYDGSSSELSTGCYYNFQHYGEGDRIITNEPCLNCTCHNRMLMCYLRVCPFTKAIGQNCTIEKKPGQCCPLIICPEVPVQLLTSSTTTEHSESMPHRNQIGYGQYSTAIGHLDDYGCKINGEFYTNGAQIPGNIDKPCEVCYCIRNRTACIMQECTLQVEGCIPVYEEGLCCPVRYQCDYEYNYNAITTEQPRPTPGLVLTTTTSGPYECQHDNKWYGDGAMVETEDSCEHCYCMKGDIVCAVQECKPPFEKDGHNCTAMPPPPGKCCPDSYHCDGNEIVDESEPTFRQDRMHKFGQNNANITMSITSSTSSADKQHGWHYGSSSNENETPNRFTDEHDKDGTTKPGKPVSDSDMMVTEGVPPTVGPLESGSHHVDGLGGVSGMRPLESHAGMRPMEKPSTGQGHGVNTDNMLTISQVIQSIVQNQTNLFNQNKFNQTGEPQKKPSQYDDKYTYTKPGMEIQTDEDGNPIEAHSGATDFPDEYYGFAGGIPHTYTEHGGKPQKKPGMHKKPGTAGTQDSAGKPVILEHGQTGGHKRPGMGDGASAVGHHDQNAPKKPVIHQLPGMDGTFVLTDDEGNPIEIYGGATGRPEEGVTEVYEEASGSFTGRPDSDGIHLTLDEFGRPYKRPIIHKKPSETGTDAETDAGSQDYTGKPDVTLQPEIYGEHGHIGRPHKRPIIHKVPGSSDYDSATEISEGMTEGIKGPSAGSHKRPGEGMDEEGTTEEYETVTDTHITYDVNELPGRPAHRPSTQTKPGLDGSSVHTGSAKPGSVSSDSDGEYIYYDKYGKPHKRPVIHKQPGLGGSDEGDEIYTQTTEYPEGLTHAPGSYDGLKPHLQFKPGQIPTTGLTDKDGKPIPETQYSPEMDVFEIFYDKYGRPHRRPVTHKKPGQTLMTDESGRPIHGVDDVTGMPESFTGKPGADEEEIFYDQYGRPHKRPVSHKKPGDGVMTDEHGKPIDGVEGVTDFPGTYTGKPGTEDQQIFYDQYGRPHKRPVTHKKPGQSVMTDEHGKPVDGEETEGDFPESVTEKPGSEGQQIFYDQYGRPHKRPVTHTKPGDGMLTDEHGKPVDAVEGVTELTDSFTGKPGTEDQEIFYDEHGRPHKRPVTHKKPGQGVMTDEHGKPIHGEQTDGDFPESFTGKPGTEDQQIFYDEHGRPHKRPVSHKKPGETVMTDEDGKPVDAVEGVTDFPEAFTGKPGTEDQQIFYDEHGRPHKRPVTHKRPGDGMLTDEYGKPVDGVESVTGLPESFTGKPGTEDQQIFYDEHGRPHRRPVTHKKPGQAVMTDEHGKPVDGEEIEGDLPESVTGKPGTEDQQIFYDEHGRPYKRPVTYMKPGQEVMTDEHGKPIDGVEGVTDFPESFTSKPGTEDQQIFYDKYGRPHKRPVTHKKPGDGVLTDENGKPTDGVEGVTDFPETFTGKPGTEDQQIFYDEHGRPHKRPVSHKKPGQGVMTDEHGKPVDGEEIEGDLPESVTGKPGTEDQEIFYDEHGRPHKRPVTHKKPGQGVMTDEHGKPVDAVENVTDLPDSFTGKPGTEDQQIFYDQYGRPHKRPVTHKKPGVGLSTDEYGKPIDGVVGVTGLPESFTGKPGTEDQEIFYDKYGRPHKRPVSHKKPGDGMLTDEHGKPVDAVEGVTDFPESFTGKPGTEDQQIFYDEHGRPHKRPVSHKKPGDGIMTDELAKPDTYDHHVHLGEAEMKPGQFIPGPEGVPIVTDDAESSVGDYESVTGQNEGYTSKPESDEDGDNNLTQVGLTDSKKRPVRPGEQISSEADGTEPPEIFGEHGHSGRPHKRPSSHVKPDDDDTQLETDEKSPGKPVVHHKPGDEDMTYEKLPTFDGMTEIPEEHTGRPGTETYQIFYDQDGKPHRRPVIQKKPGDTVSTNVHEQTDEGTYTVTDAMGGVTKKPEGDNQVYYYDKYGRPHKRPVSHKKPGQTVTTDEHSKPVDGVEGVTEFPDAYTGKPGTEDQQIFYDEEGRPHKKPVQGVLTDEHGKPVDGVEDVTGLPESFSGKPGTEDQQIFYDEHGRPHKKPVTHKKPGQTVMTDEDGKPVDAVEDVTDLPDSLTSKPGTEDQQIFYDQYGRPHKRPVTHKKPGQTVTADEDGKPVDGEETEGDFPESVTGKPGTEDQQIFYDQYGRPHKRPVSHKKPGDGVLTDEDGKPVDAVEGVTDLPDSLTSKPGTEDQQIFYDQYGRPHKRPVTHKKPGQTVMTDEHGKPVDGEETEGDFPESVTGKPGTEDQEIFYDEHGRPHKRPVTHKKPGQGVMTDEHGKPIDGEQTEGDFPESFTGKPGTEDQEIFFDEHGRPHKRPVTHKKPGQTAMTDEHGKPIHGEETEGDLPESVTGKPGTEDQQIFYDEHGRPHKRPVTDKKPGQGISFVADGKPGDDITDKPSEEHIIFDSYGRPIKRPVSPTRPGDVGMTDEEGNPVYELDEFTESSVGITGSPESVTGQIFYDEFGKPHKKPVVHMKPDSDGITQHGVPGQIHPDHPDWDYTRPGVTKKPSVEYGETVTEEDESTVRPSSEGFTDQPGSDQTFFGETGRPQKKPVIHKEPTNASEGMTKIPEDHTKQPAFDDLHPLFGEHGHSGRPQKRPIGQKHPSSTDNAEDLADTGSTTESEMQIFYDEHGRPLKKPVINKEPSLTDDNESPFDVTTVASDSQSNKPVTEETEIFYDKFGRPHKKPVIHKKPDVEETQVMTDETGQPVEKETTGAPEEQTAIPENDEMGLSGEKDKKPAGHVKPDSDGTDVEEQSPEENTRRPESGITEAGYDQDGQPQKKPVTHPKPGTEGMAETQEKPTEETEAGKRPEHDEMPQIYGEHGHIGRPQKKPDTQEQPGMDEKEPVTEEVSSVDSSTAEPEEMETVYDMYGRPHKRPVSHKEPGSVTDDTPQGISDLAEGFTGKPATDEQEIYYDSYGRPHKRPVTQKTPGEIDTTNKQDQPVEGIEAITESSQTEKPEDSYQDIFYDKYGRPHKRPSIQEKPDDKGSAGEDGKPVEEADGLTHSPEGFTTKPDDEDQQIYYDHYGRPHKKPVIYQKPDINEVVQTDGGEKPEDETETSDKEKPAPGDKEVPEGFTSKPDSDDQLIFYDESGRPVKKPVTHDEPGQQVLTDEHGKPIEGHKGTTVSPVKDKVSPEHDKPSAHDEDGQSVKRPGVHMKPEEPETTSEHGKPDQTFDIITELPEENTGKPESDSHLLFYDQLGRPHKRPVTHKKPGDGVLTDEHGKPLDAAQEVTDLPDSLTSKPETEDQQIFYDEHGRPHKRPVPHKKPGQAVMTDEHGKPVDAVEGVTDLPESFTGTPGTEDQQVFYDEHGRPHKRPVPHKKPGQAVMTDEHGKPVDAVEGVTDFPEAFTGKPGTQDQQIFYDQYGRPHKRPVSHKKPGETVMTNEHGKPVDGEETEGDFPESVTGKPGTEDQQVFYDEHGRPHKRPVSHGKPGQGVMTDEHGKPIDAVEGVTELTDSFTDKPGTEDQQIFFDEHGRPHKRPVTHKKPGDGVLTDEDGKPVDAVEGVTDLPDSLTSKPGTEDQQIFYDQYGRPHKRPVSHKKPGETVMTDEHGKPVDGEETEGDFPESVTGKPGTEDQQIFYDEHGRPHKRPVTDKKPGDGVLTDDHGKPIDGVEGVSDFPETFTRKPGSEDQQIFYDDHGRPHKKPVIHKKPGQTVMTDEDGKPVDGEPTEGHLPESFTGKPETEDQQIFYDKYGRPHKRPVSHKKPEDGVITDEHGKPVDGEDTEGDFPESVTGKPGTEDQQIFFDEHGRPHKRPVSHKKPGETVMTDEDGKPVDAVEGVTDFPEAFTGKPGTEDQQVFYDKYGRPHKRPVTHKKPGDGVLTDEDGKPTDGVEGVTDFPETFTGKPGTEDQQVFYDEHGRPHKRPVTHKKPGDGVLTDEHGKPVDAVEGVTDLPDSLTSKPGTEDQEIFYDQYGRPHKKPVEGVLTDEHAKPVDAVEGVTDLPDSLTAKPETEHQEIFYDEHGRPHKRPVTHKKPGQTVITGEHGKPADGEETEGDFPESVTGKPGTEDQEIFYDEHGRPHKRPVIHKEPVEGVMTDEQGAPEIYGEPHKKPGQFIPGPEGVAVPDEMDKPDDILSSTESSDRFTSKPETSIDETVETGKPDHSDGSHDHGKPVAGEPVSAGEETSKPHVDGEHDEVGRPQETPVGSQVPIDEHGQPAQGGLPESHDATQSVYDDKKPDSQEPVGMTDDNEVAPVEDMTETTVGSVGKPGTADEPMIYGEHGHTGRPHKRPGMPDVSGTDGSQDVSDTLEGEPGSPTTDGHGVPASEATVHKVPETSIDHVATDAEKPGMELDETATKAPEEGNIGESDQQLHKKPDTEDSQPTDGITEAPDKGISGVSDQHPQEETKPASGQMRPETQAPHESVTEKPGLDGVATYYDESGKKPVDSEPEETHKLPGKGSTEAPEAHEHEDDLEIPMTTSGSSEGGHTTEEGLPSKPEEEEKPEAAGSPEKEPEIHDKDTEQVSEPVSPHKKPVPKPSVDAAGVMVDEGDVSEAEKPEVTDEEVGLQPSKKPITDGDDDGIESTTTVSSDAVHDTKDPGPYDGDLHVSHKPEENEIFKGPEKDVPGTQEDIDNKLPEAILEVFGGPTQPQKKPTVVGHGTEDGQTQKPVIHKTPEYGHPSVDGVTTGEDEEDESLIITTDESGEDVTEMPGVPQLHEKPESDAEEKPLDTKTKVPSGVAPGQTQQGSTPGLGSASDDFITPGYGVQDTSGVPVTDVDGVVSPDKPSKHEPEASVGFDEENKVTTPVVTDLTGHGVTDESEDHAKPASGDRKPVTTESSNIPVDSDDESKLPEKDQGTPAGSDTTVGDVSPTKETDASVKPGIIKPVSTPEGTHAVPDSTGSAPSGDVKPVVGSSTETPGVVSGTKPAPGKLPQIPAAYLPPEYDSNTKHPVLIDEGLHESSAPFDEVLNNLANVLRPSHTTEESVGVTEDHGEVPGEGSCFMDGVTYPHNSDVPPLSPCHTKCTCISSIIHCLSLKCPPPPEDVSQCTVVQEENSCCPIYVCGTDVSPTLPIENHEEEATTVPSADKDEPANTQDYEMHKPTEQPLAGSTSRKPEVTASEASHVDGDVPTKHDGGEKTSQKPKPGTVSDLEKPQFIGETPVESDKGTPLTERPEEDSEEEIHPGQGMAHSTTSKPGPAGIEIPTEDSKLPAETSEDGTTPATSHFRPGAPQSGYHPVSFDSKHPSTALPTYFGTGKPEFPDQPHHRPESVDHVLDTVKPSEEGTVEPAFVGESDKPDEEKQTATETGDHKPDDFVAPTTYRPVYEGTRKPVTPIGGSSQEDKTPGQDVAGHVSTEKPSVAADETESMKPEETEKETEHKPDGFHEHDDAEIGTQSTPAEEESVKKPDEKPDKVSPTKSKPQDGQESEMAGEPDDQTTKTPGEEEKPQVAVDEDTVHSTSMPHSKPEVDVKPTYLDETVSHTTAKPHGEPSESEDSELRPTNEPEKGFDQSHKPGSHYGPVTTDVSEESDTSSKRPITHDKPSEEEHFEHPDTLATESPMEVSETKKPGQPAYGTQDVPEDGDEVSTDKTPVGASKPTDESVADGEEPHKKPESTDGLNEVLTHSTDLPLDQLESGKPMVPSGETVDKLKKPQTDQDEGLTATSEGVHKDTETEMHPSPMGEDTAHVTTSPEEQPSDVSEPHKHRPGDHPTSMDSESQFSTEESFTEDKKPHGKPQTDGYPTVTDGSFTTTEAAEEPSEVEQPHTKPQPGEGAMVKPEDSIMKGPTVPGTGDETVKVPLGEQESDMVRPTSGTHITGGKPEATEPHQGQDVTSSTSPKPTGLHGISGQGKPQPDDIPEEVLLYPTRTPGTYETQRPHHKPESEEDDTPTQRPHTEDDILATIFPEGIIRPITKRPIFGTGKPEVDDDKESAMPDHPFIHHRPQIDQVSGTPEDLFDVTRRPIFDIMTNVPEDFAAIFGIKPSTEHGLQPDKDEKPEYTTSALVPDPVTKVPDYKPQITDHMKRPIHTTNGTHFIQYVPFKEGELPHVPEGAVLGPIVERPEGDKYYTIIYTKPTTATSSTTPAAEVPEQPSKPVPQQVFNGTHFIQYVPYEDGKEPEIPEGTTLAQPQKGPDGQIYWPIIGDKPVTLPEDKPTIEQPYPGQVYNGTHFIQFVPFREGQKPEVPEDATLGEIEIAPNGQKFWPIISMKPIPEEESVTSQRPSQSQPEQIFNGTHFIQFAPYNDGEEPDIPEEATLGQPQKGPDDQIYWPVIDTKPLPMIPGKVGSTTEKPFQPEQVFNGTNFIQYVPFKEGVVPEVPEGATLGQPQKAPDGQMYWPIVYMKPKPTTPEESFPEQVFNGTNFIQYVPYKDGQKPEVPEGATLGQPQKAPDGQMYWPIVYMKPKPVKPEGLFPEQVFNGTNFIQYVPYKDGQKPEVPEGATLGQPQKAPDGQMYWPIVYMKPKPTTPEGSFSGPVYNGTNFIQYVPYKDGQKPEVPNHATLGQPEKAPDGQMYWPIIYIKPVTAKPEEDFTTEKPFETQTFNGTHFIQYVPYTEGFEPSIPEEAVLGKPEKKPDGQTYWPIIYENLPTTQKPETVEPHTGQLFNGTHFIQYLPYRPSHKPHVPEGVTISQPQKGPDGQMYWVIVSTELLPNVEEKPVEPQMFNGTHFIQYVPYEEGKRPHVPEGAILGKPERGSGGQRFWPIIYMKPLPGVPITYQKPLDQEQEPSFHPSKGQTFNGTHYIQYVPYEPGRVPQVPETGTLGQLTKRPDGQIYWPIIFQRPVPGVPITYDDQFTTFDPIKGPVFNGTHYVQYVPYTPGERPVLPEGATLGHPTKRPDGQLYWPIYYFRPVQGTPVQRPMYSSPFDYNKPQPFKPQPEQVYNGTHFIQYLPYNPTRMPEVPEGATLGQPQKGPGGQMYWVIISDKPLPAPTFNGTHVVQYVTPVTPEQDKPLTDQTRPIQVFNGSHYIQYVPYTPGQKPVLPEGASLGQPTKGPEGEMYWPIIYMKSRPGTPSQEGPMLWGPGQDYFPLDNGQIFNGTHYIRFIKYDPSTKPKVPEEATISGPQRRPNGQLYWVVASRKPLSDLQVPAQQHPGQIFNGTHYIQYVPYNSSQMPQVPEGAILGHPQKGPEGQMYWVIISDKPLPAQPGTEYVQYVTPVTPEDDQMLPGTMFNGTHYIQYVPYKHAQVPKVPQDAVLGELHKGPGGQMYWPIIYRRPPQGLHFNGTHYIQHAADNATGTDASKPSVKPASATSKPTDHPFWSYGQYAPRPGNGTRPSVNKFPGQKPGTEEHAFWTYGHDKPQNGSEDSDSYKPATEYPTWSSGQTHNATRLPQVPKLPSAQYGGSDHSKPYDSGYYNQEKPERPSTPEESYEAIDEDHMIEYPSGSDYDDTQEQPYGPGTCRYAGKVYVSAQQIPRDDPCDFCFCFRSDIICLQQSCPPPIPGCHEEPIQGFCCPRYECHVRMATLLNVTSTTTTTTTTLPPHFLSHVYKGAAGRTGCFIQGKAYRVGQAIPSASGPCMDCMCGGDGKMKCEPKVCTPEPMVRQMMVSSEKPTTANLR